MVIGQLFVFCLIFDFYVLHYIINFPYVRKMNLGFDRVILLVKHSMLILLIYNMQIPLSSRFRSLKLWFTIRSYGVEGL